MTELHSGQRTLMGIEWLSETFNRIHKPTIRCGSKPMAIARDIDRLIQMCPAIIIAVGA